MKIRSFIGFVSGGVFARCRFVAVVVQYQHRARGVVGDPAGGVPVKPAVQSLALMPAYDDQIRALTGGQAGNFPRRIAVADHDSSGDVRPKLAPGQFLQLPCVFLPPPALLTPQIQRPKRNRFFNDVQQSQMCLIRRRQSGSVAESLDGRFGKINRHQNFLFSGVGHYRCLHREKLFCFHASTVAPA
jgi:hypothetical protein